MTKAGAAITIPVLLLGCGGVGRHLLHHIVATRDLHSRRGLVLRVLGVCDSRSLLLVDDVFAKGFDDAFLTEICRMKSSSSSLSALVGLGHCHLFTDVEATTKILEVAGLLGRSSGLAVVDCSASSETVGLLKQVTIPGCCLILANKKPLTCAIEDYDKLTSDFRRIRFESTVGAGLPIIVSVTRVITSGDPICRIIGSLSGTLGYVMSEVDDRRLLSEVVLAAKSLGYTEPGLPSTRMEEVLPACKSLSCANSASYVSVKSLFIRNLHKLQPDCGFMLCALGCDVAHENPRDDLSGMDVARKALILARLLGWRINMDDIQVESLYPNELGPNSMSTEDFFKTGLPSLDRNIKERVSAASSRGKVLRYVCIIEDSRCQVGLQELPKDSALGRLRGSDNVVEIYSRCYSKSPLVIQGAGAGNDTTAAGVLADIIDLQDLFHQV